MRTITWLLLGLLALPAAGASVDVAGLRMWRSPDSTRLVFDLSTATEHRVFTLAGPDRLVIDLSGAAQSRALPAVTLDGTLVQNIRTAPRNGTDLRIVLDLNAPVRVKSFTLKPYDEYGHRLVVDMFNKTVQDGTPRQPRKFSPADEMRDVVIAIDAGHGGEDPGARGKRGTREKDVVLAIARHLERLINSEPGMRPVMIRTGDYYIGLRERMRRARQAQADLFVSIHADAFRDARAHGSSVYALSQRGASSEAARWLAESENAADLIGGVSLDDKDELLASVLLDLSQTATIEASMEVASSILKGLKRIGKVHKRQVQQAGFVVLKSPDIPSVLVETAFISNPQEEARLRSSAYQRRLAGAIMQGVRGYFQKYAPPGTRLASVRRHVIQRGDTLSELAQRYRVSTASLRDANRLTNDLLRVGAVLRIPVAAGGS